MTTSTLVSSSSFLNVENHGEPEGSKNVGQQTWGHANMAACKQLSAAPDLSKCLHVKAETRETIVLRTAYPQGILPSLLVETAPDGIPLPTWKELA